MWLARLEVRVLFQELAKRINKTLQRADQIETQEGKGLSVDTWFAPIVADAEAERDVVAERAAAITEIRALMAEYSLSIEDLNDAA